eukprot:PLAT11176.1.p2 GENE.PLAT11176.1~~PLAT11176.1.p2  ORF type:complete len:126 (+),score=29.25 PLAT11176.1:23-379(+)
MPLLADVQAAPASAVLVAICVALWFHLWNASVPHTAVAIQYHLVVRGKQFWRLLTGPLSHLGALHLLFNMSSLWNLRAVEQQLGTAGYLKVSFLLLVLSTTAYLAAVRFIALRCRIPR